MIASAPSVLHTVHRPQAAKELHTKREQDAPVTAEVMPPPVDVPKQVITIESDTETEDVTTEASVKVKSRTPAAGTSPSVRRQNNNRNVVRDTYSDDEDVGSEPYTKQRRRGIKPEPMEPASPIPIQAAESESLQRQHSVGHAAEDASAMIFRVVDGTQDDGCESIRYRATRRTY